MFSLEREQLEFIRLANLSDAIFAIALTLLVLSIPVPDLGSDDVSMLGDELLDLHHELFAYLLSFLVIGRFWIVHHRLFGYLARADGPFVLLNLAFLAAVAFVPFPTELFGSYAGETPAVFVYAATMALVSTLSGCLWLIAARRGLMHDAPAEDHGRTVQVRAFIPAAAFAASVPLAFVIPGEVPLLWLLLFLRPPARHQSR